MQKNMKIWIACLVSNAAASQTLTQTTTSGTETKEPDQGYTKYLPYGQHPADVLNQKQHFRGPSYTLGGTAKQSRLLGDSGKATESRIPRPKVFWRIPKKMKTGEFQGFFQPLTKKLAARGTKIEPRERDMLFESSRNVLHEMNEMAKNFTDKLQQCRVALKLFPVLQAVNFSAASTEEKRRERQLQAMEYIELKMVNPCKERMQSNKPRAAVKQAKHSGEWEDNKVGPYKRYVHPTIGPRKEYHAQPKRRDVTGKIARGADTYVPKAAQQEADTNPYNKERDFLPTKAIERPKAKTKKNTRDKRFLPDAEKPTIVKAYNTKTKFLPEDKNNPALDRTADHVLRAAKDKVDGKVSDSDVYDKCGDNAGKKKHVPTKGAGTSKGDLVAQAAGGVGDLLGILSILF